MNFNYKKMLCLAVAAATLALSGSACTKPDAPVSVQGSTLSNTTYAAADKASVPTRFENVTGVALYSVNAELKEQLALLADKTPAGSERFFVLLNPKMPTEGILVRSPQAIDTTPENLSNHRIAVTGNVITIDKTDSGLTDCFTEKYGFSLAGDAQKRPVYVDAEIIDDPDAKRPDVPSGQSGAVSAPAGGGADAAGSAPAADTHNAAGNVQESTGTSQAVQSEAEPPSVPSAAAPAPAGTAQVSAQTAVSEADRPADVPVQNKAHSLNVTPMAPKAQASQTAETTAAPAAPASPAQEHPQSETAANTSETAQDAAAPQDIAPTSQPLSAPPVPQDVAPTSQPLE